MKILTRSFSPYYRLYLWDWNEHLKNSLVDTFHILRLRVTLGVHFLSHCSFWKASVQNVNSPGVLNIFYAPTGVEKKKKKKNCHSCTFSVHILTTDNVQGTQCHVIEAVEWTLPCLLVQLVHQDLSLLVHHLQEVRQDGEVEGGSQHLSPLTPLCPSADEKERLLY